MLRFAVGLGAVVAIWLALALHEWPDEVQRLSDGKQVLGPGQAYAQPLSLSKPGLYRVDVALFRKGAATGQVILRLTAGAEGVDEIAKATASVECAEDVSKVIRRPYTHVAFRLPTNRPVPVGSVWLWLESQADIPIGMRGTLPAENEFRLALKVYYRRSPVENLGILLSRLGGRGPYVGIILFVYGMLLTALCCINK